MPSFTHRYIYTNVLKDLELSELFETFMAGDKYLVYKMSDTMFSFIKNVLNLSNCFIIYNQLMKFPTGYACVPLDEVKTIIRYNSASAFMDKHFVNISQETLVDLLSMDVLNIEEIDVLRSCEKWVAEEIKQLNLEPNATNKQMVFKPIKNLIKFSKIPFDQLRNFNPIKDLLSSEELSSLFLDVSKFTVECNTARKTLRRASCSKHLNTPGHKYINTKFGRAFQVSSRYGSGSRTEPHRYFSEFSTVFKASGSIYITHVFTFLQTNVEDLKFSVKVSGENVEINYEKLRSWTRGDNCWYFRLIDFVKIDATKDYEFAFKFRNTTIAYNKLSRDTTMIVDDKSLDFNLSSIGVHCLKRIDFFPIS